VTDDDPRRRAVDRDRRRWNDQAIDGLAGRVDSHGEQLTRVHERVDRLYDVLVVEKPDGTASPAPTPLGGIDWKTVLAVMTGIVVPIVGVIIATSGTG